MKGCFMLAASVASAHRAINQIIQLSSFKSTKGLQGNPANQSCVALLVTIRFRSGGHGGIGALEIQSL